jgi:hypothetical protein
MPGIALDLILGKIQIHVPDIYSLPAQAKWRWRLWRGGAHI